jgi:radical SAM protein with 4Fe4S-binding SPASM domain
MSEPTPRLGRRTVVQQHDGRFYLYASLSDTLVATEQSPQVLLASGGFSEDELTFLEEASATAALDADQLVEDAYLEKFLSEGLHPYVELTAEGRVSEAVAATLEATPMRSLTWLQTAGGQVDPEFLQGMHNRFVPVQVQRLTAEVTALLAVAPEPLPPLDVNLTVGAHLMSGSQQAEHLAAVLKRARSVTVTIPSVPPGGTAADTLTRFLTRLAELLPLVNVGLQEDRRVGVMPRSAGGADAVHALAAAVGIPIRNAVIGTGPRPLGCPAAAPDVVYIDVGGAVRKCPAAGPEGILGQADGRSLRLDTSIVARWAAANGYRSRRTECLDCGILPRCFGESCPRNLLLENTTHCLSPDAHLLKQELSSESRVSDGNSDAARWMPLCAPSGLDYADADLLWMTGAP